MVAFSACLHHLIVASLQRGELRRDDALLPCGGESDIFGGFLMLLLEALSTKANSIWLRDDPSSLILQVLATQWLRDHDGQKQPKSWGFLSVNGWYLHTRWGRRWIGFLATTHLSFGGNPNESHMGGTTWYVGSTIWRFYGIACSHICCCFWLPSPALTKIALLTKNKDQDL